MSEFIQSLPTLENYWRSIILFGQNVASYKFALAHSLLELAGSGRSFVSLEELAIPYTKHLSTHLQSVPKQSTSSNSRFLDSCRAFNEGRIDQEQLITSAVRLGFNNVIDAFHIVNKASIPQRFFMDERRGPNRGITLTDSLLALPEVFQSQNLPNEVEARWKLVETAWHLNLSKNLIMVDYEATDGVLVERSFRRTPITSCRDALNGYQKGKCFYCFSDISVLYSSKQLADVDHFFPHTLKPHGVAHPVDGVWNLVLACKNCNRGIGGKFAQLPTVRYLERLHRRNEFLICSHHPLRETLISQTGVSEPERRRFLQNTHNQATALLVQLWKPAFEHSPAL